MVFVQRGKARSVRWRVPALALGLITGACVGFVPAAGAQAAAWSQNHLTDPAQGHGALNAIACPAATLCVAVGASRSAAGDLVPLAEQWDGSEWTIGTAIDLTPNLDTSLSAVSCPTTTFCMAVGSSGDAATDAVAPVAEMWNGQRWALSLVPYALTTGHDALTGVACASASSCVAIGGAPGGLGGTVPIAVTWNGRAWATTSMPQASSGAFSVAGIACPASNDCVAVGAYDGSGVQAPLVEQWSGTAWSISTDQALGSTTAGALSAVACPAAGSCVAVGSRTSASGSQTLTEQLAGGGWTVDAASTPGRLNALWCASLASCTGAGILSGSAGSTGAAQPLAQSWNGQTWTTQATPDPASTIATALAGVACPTATACVAVGTSTLPDGFTTDAVSYGSAAGAWTLLTTPDPAGVSTGEVADVACPSASSCFAVGATGQATIDQSTPLADHWNGLFWVTQTGAVPAGSSDDALAAVSCGATNACLAVGSTATGGFAERSNGTSWTLVAAPGLPGGGAALACPPGGDCMLVGDATGSSGTTTPEWQEWNGTAWSAVQAMPTGGRSVAIDAVSCSSATACLATGAFNVGAASAAAEVWNGSAWKLTPTPAGNQLAGVACVTATDCVTVGSAGGTYPIADIWNGAGWLSQSPPVPAGTAADSLQSVSCTSGTQCVAVGDDNQASASQGVFSATWNGDTWTSATLSLGPSIGPIACASASACVAAGVSPSSEPLPVVDRYGG